MIDLHTHTFLSDGVLISSELVRRARVNGIKAIAITDHVDPSNIDVVITATVKVSGILNKYWDIKVIPGVEITHVPVEIIGEMVVESRKKGAKIVVIHGESPVEPVIVGTNRAGIEAGADIIAHPGELTEEDAVLAKEKGVFLEITTRTGHCKTNKHVFDIAMKVGASLVINTDSHAPCDIMTKDLINKTLSELTDDIDIQKTILSNSRDLANNIK